MKIVAIVATLVLLAGVSTCQAQVVSTYSPVMMSRPHVVYYPSQAVAAPPRSAQVVTAYYQSAQPAVPVQRRVVLQPVGGVDGCACAPALNSGYRQVGYGAVTAYRPLLPVMQMPGNVAVGRGILGQPTVYVPGQPVRNLLRYLSP